MQFSPVLKYGGIYSSLATEVIKYLRFLKTDDDGYDMPSPDERELICHFQLIHHTGQATEEVWTALGHEQGLCSVSLPHNHLVLRKPELFELVAYQYGECKIHSTTVEFMVYKLRD